MKYGGKYIIPLTKEEILNRVSQEDLWRYYVTNFKSFRKKFKSELREDSTASCSIAQLGSNCVYIDFKTKEKLDIFRYLMKKYNLTFHEVLRIINNDFNLNLNNPQALPEIILTNDRVPKIKEKSVTTYISVKIRDFEVKDFEYWTTQYGITLPTLNLYRVFPLEHYYITKGDVIKKSVCSFLTYGYWDGNLGWKIYSPYAEKEEKWITNIKGEYYFGYDRLPQSGDICIITKALKDVMVYKELNFNALCPQSEGYPVSSALIEDLKQRFKMIVVNYDNDETGLSASKTLCEKFNLTRFTSPEQKDISDFRAKNGVDKTLNLLKNVKSI